MILFNNKEILIDGRTVFYHDWVENGVFTLHDVIGASGNFLPFEQFQQRYGINCHFLSYFQVISAIPSALWTKVKEHAKPNVNFLSGGTLFQLSSVLTIDLLKLNKRKPQATGPMKWDRNFAPTFLPWNQIFDRVKVICKENQLRELYFKVTVYLQGCLARKRCSACSLSFRYLNPYIKLKLMELAIKLYQEF